MRLSSSPSPSPILQVDDEALQVSVVELDVEHVHGSPGRASMARVPLWWVDLVLGTTSLPDLAGSDGGWNLGRCGEAGYRATSYGGRWLTRWRGALLSPAPALSIGGRGWADLAEPLSELETHGGR
jgi:hypothetical protein